ncbi:Callose synthase 1 [Ananas comosus]|uniref:Callose synthase 1 n=1 Tax=Ananas comosus TaxID=4615 RepID=A0A199UQ77_ANACO|nr:Callose synthase 1 [Ananas comosus]
MEVHMEVKRLDLLLTVKESAMDVPTNLEARRHEWTNFLERLDLEVDVLSKALELQAFLDMAKDEDLMEGYKAAELMSEEHSKLERSCGPNVKL